MYPYRYLLTLGLSLACACQTGTCDTAEPTASPVWLYVVHSGEATLSDGMLTMTGVLPAIIAFTDRPYREFSTTTLADLADDWAEGSDSFEIDPPNAIVDGVHTNAGGTSSQCSVEVELMAPPVPGAAGEGSWEVVELTRFEGCPETSEGPVSWAPVSVFIDFLDPANDQDAG